VYFRLVAENRAIKRCFTLSACLSVCVLFLRKYKRKISSLPHSVCIRIEKGILYFAQQLLEQRSSFSLLVNPRSFPLCSLFPWFSCVLLLRKKEKTYTLSLSFGRSSRKDLTLSLSVSYKQQAMVHHFLVSLWTIKSLVYNL
jgi:hypothetical protein